jgi:hypothetical protein
MTDVNAVFSTDTIGVELSALPNGAFYIEQKGYLRPRLAKGYFMTPERIKTYAIANAAFVGAVDERTAALMPDYQQRWTRPNQRELLETIAGRRGPGISAQAVVADTEEEEEGEAVSPDWDELNNMLPQVPQDLIDKANRAAELDQIAQEGKEDLAKLNESLNTGLASEIAELERRLAMPVVPDEQRNTTTRPADPQQPTGEPLPLPADTLALLGALAATNLLYTQQRWVRSTDILTAVANMLGWPNNTEGGRRLSAALAPVGVESTRESIEGKKYTVYPMVALREAIKQHHQK